MPLRCGSSLKGVSKENLGMPLPMFYSRFAKLRVLVRDFDDVVSSRGVLRMELRHDSGRIHYKGMK